MTRCLIAFGAVAALLSAGCVPVTEPVGDIDKAEPDKALVGAWKVTAGTGWVDDRYPDFTIDEFAVKGNPKGLMRFRTESAKDNFWFYSATVGKHTYANGVCALKDGDDPPAFGKEGAFAKWKGEKRKRYQVFRYTVAGDTLTIDCGNHDAFDKLMKDAGVRDDGRKYVAFFDTPAGWYEKHFDKGGTDTIFDGMNVLKAKREKKK